MKNSDSSTKVKKGAVIFDDRDSFGIIKSILRMDWPIVAANGKRVEIDPSRLARLLERTAAQWIVERGEALVPREVLLQLLDSVVRGEVRAQDYKIYRKDYKELSLSELLDALLPDTNLYPVSDSEYFLAPIEPSTRRDAWHLCRVLVAAARSGWEEALKVYHRAFAGEDGGEPIKWYYERLVQAYGLH